MYYNEQIKYVIDSVDLRLKVKLRNLIFLEKYYLKCFIYELY